MLDYLIVNAQILDGSGAPAFAGDVAVSGGRIAAVGRLSDAPAAHVLDAEGRFLTPGFLDIHRHGDGALFGPDFGLAELAQGLTTVVNGCCGLSLSPVDGPFRSDVLHYLEPVTGSLPPGQDFTTLAAYRAGAAALPLRVHTGMLAGMGTLRACVAGFRDGELTDAEYRSLHRLLERALSGGALGISLGLGYAPECFYTTGQLLRALAPLRDSGVVLSVHMRQEGDGVVEALEEMLAVARALRTPVEISHLKAIGRRNWRRAVPQMLRMLDAARDEGLDVSCDVYPYEAGSTQLIHVLPPEFQAGGPDALTAALLNPAARAAMRRRMETGSDFENISLLVGFENIQATSLRAPENQAYEGLTITGIAAAQSRDPYEALFDLLAAERCAASMIDRINDGGDIAEILQRPYSIVISDATYPSVGLYHPRVYGNVPHLLETWARQRRVLPLEEAVRKLTRLPADRLGLRRKGRVEPGADADLCLFRPENIHETATWTEPRQLAAGMDAVFVSGVPAILDGRFTGRCAGTIL